MLFTSEANARLYAEPRGLKPGAPLPVLKPMSVWERATMRLAADGGSYTIVPQPAVERRADATHAMLEWPDGLTLTVAAETMDEALRLAVAAGRQAMRRVDGRRTPRVAVCDVWRRWRTHPEDMGDSE